MNGAWDVVLLFRDLSHLDRYFVVAGLTIDLVNNKAGERKAQVGNAKFGMTISSSFLHIMCH